MDVVSQALEKAKSKYKSVEVIKPIPVEFDLGNLTAYDTNDFNDEAALRSNKREEYLQSLSRDNTQLLLNAIFHLPTNVDLDGVFAQLPAPTTLIPREKPNPKPKPMTRWERFAKTKGINKKKRPAMVYEEATGEYKPRFGYGSKNPADDWCLPVPDNSDPYEDQYEKRTQAKADAKSKQRTHEKRNREEGQFLSAGKSGKKTNNQKSAVEAALHLTRTSTASIGKFDAKLKNDTKAKGIKRVKEASSVGDVKMEKSVGMKLLDKMGKGADVLNVKKAVKEYERTERPSSKRAVVGGAKGRGGKGGKKGRK